MAPRQLAPCDDWAKWTIVGDTAHVMACHEHVSDALLFVSTAVVYASLESDSLCGADRVFPIVHDLKTTE